MVTIYSDKTSPRLRYTLKLVFEEVLGISYRHTRDPENFSESPALKINYSDTPLKDCLQIRPSGLLFESQIIRQSVPVGSWKGIPTLFANNGECIPFDLFSAAFYLASRYEEYLPFTPDAHERFEAKESIAFREGFLKLPVIDLWCQLLARTLSIEPQCPRIQPGHYRFLLTVDIDQPWAFKNKGFIYATGSLIRELLQLRPYMFYRRLITVLGVKSDPADTFTFLSEVQKQLQQPIRYFALCQNRKPFDTNLSLHKKAFATLLKKLSQNSIVGIHPSYASQGSSEVLDAEIQFLATTLGYLPEISRQHFLKLHLPVTYRSLLFRRIHTDYSMGFAASTGFRSGLAREHFFYDLPLEQETSLRLKPLHMMDRTLLDYEKLTPEEAMGEYAYFTEVVRSVGGELVCLWHNESLCNRREWKGWRRVFDEMIALNTHP